MSWRRALVRAVWIAPAAGLAWDMAAHWLGWRFAMGDWPVPDGTPWTYQLESGFIPALTVLSLLTAILGTYHLHNCHSARCWRLGKHRINGSPWCSRHEDEGRQAHAAEATLADVCERLDRLLAVREQRQ
jgi:hypothetical protein